MSPPVVPSPNLADPQCVHCGFCLPACPTWLALGTEMDSPRGRLMLMDALRDGRAVADASLVRHLDLCLGCRACETDCPSGVRYGEKLQEAREALYGSRARPLSRRLLERAVLAGVALPPRVQSAGAALLRLLRREGALRPPRPGIGAAGPLAAARRLLGGAAVELDGPPPRLPAVLPACGARRARVGLLLGCVGRWLQGSVNLAAARLLSAAGCEVVVPRGQRCCGALHEHAGDRAGARRLARVNIAALEAAGPLDAVVVTAAGCGAMVKDWGALLRDDLAFAARAASLAARARDALELLHELGPPPLVRPVLARVAYHDACHLAHAQGVRAAPRALLARVPGLLLQPLADADRCCGSAGLFNLLEPDAARAVLRGKLERLAASGADTVAAANVGCLLQLAAGAHEAGMTLVARHPLQLLAQSLGDDA